MLALWGPTSARADGVTVQVNADLDVTPTGDRRARMEIVWPEGAYPVIKKHSPDARRFLQDLASDRADSEMTDTEARYDDVHVDGEWVRLTKKVGPGG